MSSPVVSTSDEDELDRVFAALANRTRRQLLDALRDGPQTTGALCARLPGIDRCTTMQHLGVLERAGLVAVTRRGRERWNHLDVLPIARLPGRWISGYAHTSVELLTALQQQLEA